MTEDELQTLICDTAEMAGWLWHHETDSRRTRAGYPDLTLARADSDGNGGSVIIVELKSATGKVRPEQQTWLDTLAVCDRLSSGLIRPDNVDAFLARLTG